MARRSILSQLFRQSAGYVLQFKEFELYWGAVFLRLEEDSIGEVLFSINFIGVIFEAGNETR